ncbi:MAG: DegT/DnrJ/EryC1/StrS aminotransferase family protein [Spirochaetales bacterium]|nr:DegT/DnrJ/EryC1/StrS aminotransferase family protein [Spirochaetales bacterium]
MNKKERLPYALPDLGDEEIKAASRVIRSGWLTSGPETSAFEEEFKHFTGAPQALAVNSCTSALHLISRALMLGPRDAVIVPAITFIATAEAFTYEGALPLLVDVHRQTMLLDPSLTEGFIENTCKKNKNGEWIHRASGRRLRALVAVHLGGRACDLDGLRDLCREYRLKLIEDAAHALPAHYTGRHGQEMIGSKSEFAAFSFYATKNLATGEGGMLTLRDAGAADRLRRLRLHGILGQTYGRARWRYDVLEFGYKYNMCDILAAIGRVQLRRLPAMQKKRHRLAGEYVRMLQGLPLRIIDEPTPEGAQHLFTVELLDSAKLHRDELVEALYTRGIATSLHFIPLYRFTHFRKTYKYRMADFPHAEALFKRILSLPLYPTLPPATVKKICGVLGDLLG